MQTIYVKLRSKLVKALGLASLFFCLFASQSLYAQSLTEQLMQGLGLEDPTPPPPNAGAIKPRAAKQTIKGPVKSVVKKPVGNLRAPVKKALKPIKQLNQLKPASGHFNKVAALQSPQAELALSQPLFDQQNLAQQIETLKQAMVNLNRDLFILEEDLLFPASTQVAVYLTMDVGEYFALDAVEIRINNEVKTHYLYTERQVNALYRGGVQRLYVGNVNQGDHELSAYFIGVGPEHREYKRALSVQFTKDEDAVALALNVIDSSAKQQPVFEAKVL